MEIKHIYTKETLFNSELFKDDPVYIASVQDNSIEDFVIFLIKQKKHSLLKVNLNDLDFSNRDLSWADFSGSSFHNTNFMNANLKSAQLNNIQCIGTNFTNAKCMFAVFSNSNLVNTQFTNANLWHAHFNNAFLNVVDFSNANISNADFYNCMLLKININNTNIQETHIPMNCKWIVRHISLVEFPKAIEDFVILIGCKKKTIQSWDKWFESDDTFHTSRNSIEFKQIKASYESVKAYLNVMYS